MIFALNLLAVAVVDALLGDDGCAVAARVGAAGIAAAGGAAGIAATSSTTRIAAAGINGRAVAAASRRASAECAGRRASAFTSTTCAAAGIAATSSTTRIATTGAIVARIAGRKVFADRFFGIIGIGRVAMVGRGVFWRSLVGCRNFVLCVDKDGGNFGDDFGVGVEFYYEIAGAQNNDDRAKRNQSIQDFTLAFQPSL